MKRMAGFFLIIMMLFFTGCSKAGDSGSEKINVFTSILPQKYFVERIGGERVNVSVLVGPGRSPAIYEPLPDQVVALSRADLFFTIGVSFENAFVPKIEKSMKSLKIVDTSAGIKKRFFESNGVHVHDGHGEGAVDPHIWMSVTLVKQQALNIFNALAERDPGGRDYYEKNYREFAADLDRTGRELKKALAPLKGETIFVFHPAFGYFTDEYGLKQAAIETGGKEPSPFELEAVIKKARAEKVKVIFVQAEFSQKSARAIAEAIGGAVVILNPLDPDYINNMLRIAYEIKKAL